MEGQQERVLAASSCTPLEARMMRPDRSQTTMASSACCRISWTSLPSVMIASWRFCSVRSVTSRLRDFGGLVQIQYFKG